MSILAFGSTVLVLAAIAAAVHRAPAQHPTPAVGEISSEPRPPVWPFVLAVVLPVIGFVLGAIEAAKHSAGRGAAIMALSLVAAFAWYSVYLSSTGQDRCVITAVGGSKLCGSDARAWCDSTDALRGLAGDTRSQAVCDELRR
jgi:hypothetical protein